MPQYMFILAGDESVTAALSQEDWEAGIKLHGEFAQEVARRGATIVGGAALAPSATATTVRFEGGEVTSVTDGPFAELKEGLGGYYTIDCRDLDQALELAKILPMGEGAIEIRPTVDGTTDV